MDFNLLRTAVAAQFERMCRSGPLYRVDIERDALWDGYLAGFPEGSNPVFRKRAEHDCSCCRGFVKNMGNVVAIKDGKLASIWDVTVSEPAYQAVADALSALVKSRPIVDSFLHFERSVGQDKSFEQGFTDQPVTTWTHFHVTLPAQYVQPNKDIPTALNDTRSLVDVMRGSLERITPDACQTVLELIAQGSLYRGEEHVGAVTAFAGVLASWGRVDGAQRPNWVWEHAAPVGRIKNTAIGTLLLDLSGGMDIEDAVKRFEVVMAPANYKRPTALVTKAMIDRAKAEVDALGLGPALPRRYAHIGDVTANNILFVDRAVRQRLAEADPFAELGASVAESARSFDKVEAVGIEDFMRDILPRAESIELFLENNHAGNLVSLIAPADPTAPELFTWNNRFSWSYSGNVTDAIKERVKAAGGSVTGDLCCRLAWDYIDDLDFHMIEPNGFHLYFMNKRQTSPNGGVLDLDANGMDGMRADPAENIVYADRRKMREGVYTLVVNNYNQRNREGCGFHVQIEFDGETHDILYDKAMRTGENITVATIGYRAGKFEISASLPSSRSVRNLWGLNSQQFHRVNVAMLSPNFWDECRAGNKHWFFMLDECRQDGQARGFYNEFLKPELTQHRKVLEMVGGRMKVEESERQLSGLGFSSTVRANVLCRVKGAFTRVVRINF